MTATERDATLARRIAEEQAHAAATTPNWNAHVAWMTPSWRQHLQLSPELTVGLSYWRQHAFVTIRSDPCTLRLSSSGFVLLALLVRAYPTPLTIEDMTWCLYERDTSKTRESARQCLWRMRQEARKYGLSVRSRTGRGATYVLEALP